MTSFLTHGTLHRIAARLAIVGALAMLPAAPVQAGPLGGFLNCFFGGCDGGGDWGGGGDTGGGSNDDSEDVEATGVIHPVYLVGGAFFPDEIHAQPGDEIKFYNLAYTSQKVRADDWSWESDYISKDQSWSMIVQADTTGEFRRSSYGGSFYGEIFIGDKPAEVDFGDLIDGTGNVIGKSGETVKVAEGLGYTLAPVGGLVQDIWGTLGAASNGNGNGNGNAQGLTEDYGIGNNTN